MSIQLVLVWPASSGPQLAQAWRRRMVVWPSSTPTPNRSNSNLAFSGMPPASMPPCTPNRLWRTLRIAWPLLPSAPEVVGMREGRRAASQFWSTRLKSWM